MNKANLSLWSNYVWDNLVTAIYSNDLLYRAFAINVDSTCWLMYDFVRGCLVILKRFYKALDHGILDQAYVSYFVRVFCGVSILTISHFHYLLFGFTIKKTYLYGQRKSMTTSNHPYETFGLNALNIIGYIPKSILACYFTSFSIIIKMGY